VLGNLDPLALILDTLEAPLALPVFSDVTEECVLGHLNLLAPIVDALESPVALPVISRVDVSMVRHGSGVFRPAEGREQADPQREEEAKNGPGSKCVRIANAHEPSGRWRYWRVKSLLREQPPTRKMSPRGEKGGGARLAWEGWAKPGSVCPSDVARLARDLFSAATVLERRLASFFARAVPFAVFFDGPFRAIFFWPAVLLCFLVIHPALFSQSIYGGPISQIDPI
jgi:hypothetical protein